jgi:cytochrome c-type biogenesis protein CcmH
MKRHHWLLVAGLIVVGILLFALLLIVTAPTAIAPTQPPVTNLDDETMRVAQSLYCPVCPGVPLDVCETQACQQWRALIREKLGAGETPEQIERYFVAQYGERVLGAPTPEGFNLTIYIAPLAIIVVGVVILFFAARRWIATRVTDPPGNAPIEYRERIEQELRETE